MASHQDLASRPEKPGSPDGQDKTRRARACGELPGREEFGFRRTRCGCAFCQAPCRHIPGGLVPADLVRLCPAGQDLFRWAEQHLRAVIGLPAPTLVPARHPGGACHWHLDGQCLVHDDAPFGCAFFDAHQSEQEVRRRSAAAVQARQEDARAGGPYTRLWHHLCRLGLGESSTGRTALEEDVAKMCRRAGHRPARRT